MQVHTGHPPRRRPLLADLVICRENHISRCFIGVIVFNDPIYQQWRWVKQTRQKAVVAPVMRLQHDAGAPGPLFAARRMRKAGCALPGKKTSVNAIRYGHQHNMGLRAQILPLIPIS
ncbi:MULTISPECIES: hypothetical protein [unclassified Azospirillum]|uniref:hypothetical protein n=1 Tax=unclassified Azospirillum TaxID=2630922 RepID=UPI001177DA3A|nr:MULTISPECIES: hypothetical protein [unclassified Azospirillum]